MWKNKPPFAKRGLIHKEAAAATPKFVAAQLEKDAPAAAAEEPALTPVPYKAGDVVTLKVVRESEFGAFLDAGTGNTSDDILLHKLQQTEPVKIGDMVPVYIYLDPHHRLTASMKLPKMKEGQLGYARVLDVTRDGGFVDIGAERGVFLPYSEMRGHVSPDQKVWVKLYRDKSGRPAVTMRVDKDIVQASRKAQDVKVGDMVTGTIYNILDDGFFLFTTDRYIGFLHRSEAPAKRRLDFGEQLTCRVAHIRDDGRLNLSLRPQKENALITDAQALYDLMQKRGGRMPYCDDTPKEIIKEKFGLSKAAFKRALGHLMKEDKIYQEDGWTILK
jgi:predicted RNA-binding protein (virulence factor B family)